MDPLYLIVKLVLLLALLFIAEKFTRPPLDFFLRKLAAATEEFAVVLGTKLVPAMKQMSFAVKDLVVQLRKLGINDTT